MHSPAAPDTQILVLTKTDTGERYCFVYRDDEETRKQLNRIMGSFAVDADLSFSWADASTMAFQMRAVAWEGEKRRAESARKDDESLPRQLPAERSAKFPMPQPRIVFF